MAGGAKRQVAGMGVWLQRAGKVRGQKGSASCKGGAGRKVVQGKGMAWMGRQGGRGQRAGVAGGVCKAGRHVAGGRQRAGMCGACVCVGR